MLGRGTLLLVLESLGLVLEPSGRRAVASSPRQYLTFSHQNEVLRSLVGALAVVIEIDLSQLVSRGLSSMLASNSSSLNPPPKFIICIFD